MFFRRWGSAALQDLLALELTTECHIQPQNASKKSEIDGFVCCESGISDRRSDQPQASGGVFGPVFCAGSLAFWESAGTETI